MDKYTASFELDKATKDLIAAHNKVQEILATMTDEEVRLWVAWYEVVAVAE